MLHHDFHSFHRKRICEYGMQKLAQNVTGVKVPLSGHWTPEERPDLVNMLNNFFSGKPTSENQ